MCVYVELGKAELSEVSYIELCEPNQSSTIEELVDAQYRSLLKFDFIGKHVGDDPPNALRLVFRPVKHLALFAAVVDSLAARAVA